MALSSYKTLPAAWKSETKEEKRSKRHQTQSIGTETESAARFGSMHLEDKIEWPFKSESLFASLGYHFPAVEFQSKWREWKIIRMKAIERVTVCILTKAEE